MRRFDITVLAIFFMLFAFMVCAFPVFAQVRATGEATHHTSIQKSEVRNVTLVTEGRQVAQKKKFFEEEQKSESLENTESSQKDENPIGEKTSTSEQTKSPTEVKSSGESISEEKQQPSQEQPDTSPPEKKKEIAKENEQEQPRITAIEVRGNKNISTEKILSVVRSTVGDPLLEPRLRSDVQAIYDMGYFTDVKVDTPYYSGGLKIIFRVQENPVVTRVTILGNKIVSREKIHELMKIRKGEILNIKTLNADMNEINYYYNETLGYKLEPTHIKDVTWTPAGELVLSIQEGMKIEKIEVSGSTLFSEEKLVSLIETRPGDLFNTNQIKEDTDKLSKYYEEQGYILETIRPQVNYSKGEVTFHVIEAVVEDIRIEFDKKKHKTKDYVVYRNIRTRKGEVLKRKKLQRDIERLNNLGYFSRVNVEPEPGSKPGYMILVFKLKEQKTGLATIGVGYTGGGSGALRSGITGAISFTEKNLNGTGQAVSASWQRGVNVDSINASYFNPAINRNQDSFAINLFRNNYYQLRQPITNDLDDQKYALYDDKRYGGAVTYGRRITDDFRIFGTFRHETLSLTRNENSDYEPIGLTDGSLNALGLGGLYDNRNDIFDPTAGWYLDANLLYAGRILGGSYDFNKYQTELRRYFPIGKKQRSTIALRAWGGLLTGDPPISETFYVGGTDTIRGYNENQFFGTRMLVFNAEYRFPIANIKFLKGAVFADAGNAWSPGERSKLYTDAGAGLRIVFPTLGLGVIRLDYAYGEEGGRTSIGIGQTF